MEGWHTHIDYVIGLDIQPVKGSLFSGYQRHFVGNFNPEVFEESRRNQLKDIIMVGANSHSPLQFYVGLG